MSTCSSRLLYLRDGKTLSGVTKVLTSTPRCMTPDGHEYALTLEKSHFYPGGGGQPADTGRLWPIGSDMRLQVQSIALKGATEDVEIVASLTSPDRTCLEKELTPGTEMAYEVDAEVRQLHNRLHSAGHVMDLALLDVLGHSVSLSVLKAYHFPAGPSVEYKGTLSFATPNEKKAFMKKLQDACNDLIARDLMVNISFDASTEFLEDEQRGTRVPNDKALRFMSVTGFDRLIACGGTHVSSLRELKGMTIRKVEVRNGITRIGYNVI